MTSFESEGLDPGRVFGEDYWGEIHLSAKRLPDGFIRPRQKKVAKSLVAALVPKIVTGELTGQEFIAGRFDPTDPDLARASAFNMPGTVLISDIESLRPYDTFSRDEQKHPWRRGKGNPTDQSASTRHVLRASRRHDSSSTYFYKGRVIYSNDTHEYERTVSVNMLVPNIKGTSSTRDLMTLVTYDEKQTKTGHLSKPVVMLTTSTTLSRAFQIGESYERTLQDAPGHSKHLGIRRLVSLEVCMQGAPAEERMPALSRALGHMGVGG